VSVRVLSEAGNLGPLTFHNGCGQLEVGLLSVRTSGSLTPVAARRLLRRALAGLAALAERHVLSLPGECGGCILLPARTALDAASDRLSSCLPAAPSVGVATAGTAEEVPAVAERARRVTAVAEGPGMHRLRDVLLDHHRQQPPTARPNWAPYWNRWTGNPV
jgi:hypothetical protein